jgi:hypothetical protein
MNKAKSAFGQSLTFNTGFDQSEIHADRNFHDSNRQTSKPGACALIDELLGSPIQRDETIKFAPNSSIR